MRGVKGVVAILRRGLGVGVDGGVVPLCLGSGVLGWKDGGFKDR